MCNDYRKILSVDSTVNEPVWLMCVSRLIIEKTKTVDYNKRWKWIVNWLNSIKFQLWYLIIFVTPVCIALNLGIVFCWKFKEFLFTWSKQYFLSRCTENHFQRPRRSKCHPWEWWASSYYHFFVLMCHLNRLYVYLA